VAGGDIEIRVSATKEASGTVPFEETVKLVGVAIGAGRGADPKHVCGVWRNSSFDILVAGPSALEVELREFLSSSDKGGLLLVPKKTMKRLLDDDAHRYRQVGDLQQRGTELLEELRVYRRLELTETQRETVAKEMEALRERLQKSYGNTAVGTDNQE
jgi:chaperonin cofactor prefoldin